MLARVLVFTAAVGVLLAAAVVAVRPTPAPAAAAATSGELAAHNDTSTPFNLVHLPALRRASYDGRGLRVDRGDRAGRVVHHALRYRGHDLTVTGTLTRPDRPGRFPLVVLAHGYHHPDEYRSRDVSRRERVWLARRGFVVLQPDYRNYGGSTREDGGAVARPLGYPADVLNAVRAVRRDRLPFVQRGRVHLFGRSMGGGVALQAAAARPQWFASVVLSSPITSSAPDSFRRWVEPGTELHGRVAATYGLPESAPAFWRAASVRDFVGRVAVPVHLHHGTADGVCPVGWSRDTARAVRRSGGRAVLHTYSGAGHTFHGEQWRRLMRRALAVYRG